MEGTTVKVRDRKNLPEPVDTDLLAAVRLVSPAPPPGLQNRVWNHIQQGSRGRRRTHLGRRWSLLAAAVVLVLWVSLLVRVPSPPQRPFAVLWMTSGQVDAAANGTQWDVGRAGEVLSPEAQVRTSTGSRAGAKFSDAATLLGDGTVATLRRHGGNRGGIEIILARGTVAVSAKPRSSNESLRVSAAGYEIEVVGTIFSASADGQNLQVSVHQGTVAIRHRSSEVRVNAGQSWSSTQGLGTQAMDPNDVALVREMLKPVSAQAPLEIDGSRQTEVEVDGVRIGKAPVQMMSPLGSRHVTVAQGEERIEREEKVVPSGARVVLPQPSSQLLPADETRPKNAPSATGKVVDDSSLRGTITPRRLAVRSPKLSPYPDPLTPAGEGMSPASLGEVEDPGYAKRLQQAGRYREAVEAYRLLARSNGTSAEIALYEAGSIQLRHLGDARAAAQTFGEYQSRFPHGTLRAEADLNRIDALIQCGSLSTARGEVDSFLRQYPDSERMRELILLRGNLHRALGDCPSAMADYRRVLADERNDRAADDASFFSIYCEQQLGHASEVARRISRYLTRFPQGHHRHEVEKAFRRR